MTPHTNWKTCQCDACKAKRRRENEQEQEDALLNRQSSLPYDYSSPATSSPAIVMPDPMDTGGFSGGGGDSGGGGASDSF